MQYIITNGEKYLKQGIDSRYLAVDDLNDASTWQVKEKADNVVKSCSRH